ncbi:MAG: carbohydrate kinase [Acidobacteria bacterium]|nr:carbohydrate kinase [Acidobacteriota bacterium]
MLRPADLRALIAIDLGAESCRVSLLRWASGRPVITLVHRFANAPRELATGLRWDLARIEEELEEGLRRCAAIAQEGIRSIAVDGWAVDYVRVGEDGRALGDPFCYRDERTIQAEQALYGVISPQRLRELTGVQLLRINTLYQLYADKLHGSAADGQWLNLPEYVLSRLGASRVAELTNATHTGMVELGSRRWCSEVFEAVGIDVRNAVPIVPPGTVVGTLRGPVSSLPAFHGTVLIAPACHDTASAIAGIPASGDDWAYISSGTWSLVGALLQEPINHEVAAAENFTNLAAVGGRTCFHKNVNGMWLIRQCIEAWSAEGRLWTAAELATEAEKAACPEGLLDVDDPELLLAGAMPQRINAQRRRMGFEPLDEGAAGAPVLASLIFHSLAARYAEVIGRVAVHAGKKFERLFFVGGGSQNEFLNRLTAQATGLQVERGSVESSTVGNFAVQLAVLEGGTDALHGARGDHTSWWASVLTSDNQLPRL